MLLSTYILCIYKEVLNKYLSNEWEIEEKWTEEVGKRKDVTQAQKRVLKGSEILGSTLRNLNNSVMLGPRHDERHWEREM